MQDQAQSGVSGAQDRSCHEAILYSINQVFIMLHQAGVDPTEVIITAFTFTHLSAFTPIILRDSNERWCHYLHGAVEETEAERLNNLFQDVAERGPRLAPVHGPLRTWGAYKLRGWGWSNTQ